MLIYQLKNNDLTITLRVITKKTSKFILLTKAVVNLFLRFIAVYINDKDILKALIENLKTLGLFLWSGNCFSHFTLNRTVKICKYNNELKRLSRKQPNSLKFWTSLMILTEKKSRNNSILEFVKTESRLHGIAYTTNYSFAIQLSYICKVLVIHQIERKWSVPSSNKFHGNMSVSFCHNKGKCVFVRFHFRANRKNLGFTKKLTLWIFKTTVRLRDQYTLIR